MYVRFLDADRQPIKLSELGEGQQPNPAWSSADTDCDSFRAVAKPRQRIMGIPIGASSSREFTVTMPDKASYLEVLVGSVCMQSYVPPNYGGLTTPAELQTYLLCYGLPVFLLAIGIGTAVFTNNQVITMIEQIASVVVEAAASPAMRESFTPGRARPKLALTSGPWRPE